MSSFAFVTEAADVMTLYTWCDKRNLVFIQPVHYYLSGLVCSLLNGH